MSSALRSLTAARAAVRSSSLRSISARCASTWLQGHPPAVDASAGTFAALYYKEIREHDTPTRNFLVAPQQDVKFSVGDFDKLVYAYARGFIDALDIKPGDKVAVYIGNEIENLIVQYAASLAGASTVVVDPSASVEDLRDVVAAENVKALFFGVRYGSESRINKIQEVFNEELDPFTYGAKVGYTPLASKRMRSLQWIVQTGFDAVEGIVRLKDLPVYGEDGVYDHDEIAAAQFGLKPTAITTKYIAADKAATTVTQAELLAAAAATAKAAKLTNSDVLAVLAPLSSMYGFASTIAAASKSAKTVYPSKSFDAAKALAAITAQKATVVVATKAQVEALNAELKSAAGKAYDVSSVRTGLLDAQGNTFRFES